MTNRDTKTTRILCPKQPVYEAPLCTPLGMCVCVCSDRHRVCVKRHSAIAQTVGSTCLNTHMSELLVHCCTQSQPAGAAEH